MSSGRAEPFFTRFHALVAALVLAGLGLVAYHNSFDVPFVHDDEPAISDNPRIRSLWPFGSAGYAVQSTESGRPVVRLSLAINYALGGTSVRGYHVFNLAVHVLSALVLYGLLRRTLGLPHPELARFRGAAPWLALAAAAIWLVHPLNTDAVTYVIQRTELLMGFFYLATLYAALRAVDGPRSRTWFVLSVLCCALGMGCKEVMVSAPIALALYDRTFLFASGREAWARRRRLYGALACTWSILALLILSGPRNETVGWSLGVAWWEWGATQLGMILHYLRLSFWPDPLCIDYGRALARSAGEIVPGALVVGALVVATISGVLRRRAAGFLGAWFFLILAPSSSVVPIINEIGAERRMYLSLAAVVVLVVLGAHRLLESLCRRFARAGTEGSAHVLPALAGAAATLAVLVVFCGLTIRRNEVFRSDLSLWLDTVEKRPDNPTARNNLGRAYAQRKRYSEALEQFQAAIRLPDCGIDAYDNVGNALADLGRLDESVAYYRGLQREHPTEWRAFEGLGLVLIRQERWQEAIAEYQRSLNGGHATADIHSNLGMALFKVGRIQESVQEFKQALTLDPRHATAARNLAQISASLRKSAEPPR